MRSLGKGVCQPQCESVKVLSPEIYPCCIGPRVSFSGSQYRYARHGERINDWGAILYTDSQFHEAILRENLEIYDRVGGGDSFASGLIYGLMEGKSGDQVVNYGAAHGALAMTTPGDTTTASLAEVEKVMAGGTARVDR